MATFVLTYRRMPGYRSTPESMAAWMAWFEATGDDVVEMGRPVVEQRSVGVCSEATELGGYSVVRAPDLDAALSLAKGCPVLGWGGGVEIGLLGEVPTGRAPSSAGG